MNRSEKYEWATRACDITQIGIGVGYMLSGEFLGIAFILLGLTSWLYRRMRNRAYVDGWLQGRAHLLHMRLHGENAEKFADEMIAADLAMMRYQVGARETQKFIDAVIITKAARADGSHDNLS